MTKRLIDLKKLRDLNKRRADKLLDRSEVILNIVLHHLYEEWAVKLLSDLVDLFKPSISNKRYHAVMLRWILEFSRKIQVSFLKLSLEILTKNLSPGM